MSVRSMLGERGDVEPIERDDSLTWSNCSWDELFGMDAPTRRIPDQISTPCLDELLPS